MDPFLVGSFVPRRVTFLAKSTLFQGKYVRSFLEKYAVPVFRRQDQVDTSANVTMFSAVSRLLRRGWCILIFPEGLSESGRVLHKVKTGAARIAFQAENETNFTLGLKIVPVGLIYTAGHLFRSDVYINFGEPVPVADYLDQYRASSWDATLNLTQRIRDAIRKLANILLGESLTPLVERLEQVYKEELITELHINPKDTASDLFISRALISGVEWFAENDPDSLVQMENQLDRYLTNLGRLKLTDDITRGPKGILPVIPRFAGFLLGSPVWMWGVVNNYVPYLIPRIVVRLLHINLTLTSTVKLGAGMVSFPLFYSLQGWFLTRFVHTHWLIIAYLVTTPFAGLFALKYYALFRSTSQQLWSSIVHRERKQAIGFLLKQRQRLMAQLNAMRTIYEKASAA